MMHSIAFNKPFISGNELNYISDAVSSGKISGDGKYTKHCQKFFEKRYGFLKTLLTTSCTDALEMCAILCDIEPGDEVIMPSYTFVSSANPFVLRGAVIRFCDSKKDHPGIDESKVKELITSKTKAIVITHYAGISCDMNILRTIADEHDLWLIEDAAHSIDSYCNQKPLGSFGDMAAFSFHETKNIISGEGGMLVLNDASLVERAEIIREKGTNRSKFFRGEVDKYSWVDIGSSFLPSDINAAFLYGQLENIDLIQAKRKAIWQKYYDDLQPLKDKIMLPFIPAYATNNGHIFYMVTKTPGERTKLIGHLKNAGIDVIFHYLPLHLSPYYESKHDGRSLPMAEYYADCLLRLPLFYTLTSEEQQFIIDKIFEFYAG
jgi:dTDP-4-amino-4,6-dideoxygalactose transaminase